MISSATELMQALQRDSGHQQAPVNVMLNGTKYRIARVYATPGTYPAATTIELHPAPLPHKTTPLTIGQQVEVWGLPPHQRREDFDDVHHTRNLSPTLLYIGILKGETETSAIVEPAGAYGILPQYRQDQRPPKHAVFAEGTVRLSEARGYVFCKSHRIYFREDTHPQDCQDEFELS